jgi:hypothetical protein
MPSFLILDSSVCRGTPSLTAAPVWIPESGLEYVSFVLDEVGDQGSSRRSHLGSRMREPCLIYKESLPFRQNHRPFNYILQLADVSRPIVRLEEFHRLLVYVSNLLAQFLGVAVDQYPTNKEISLIRSRNAGNRIGKTLRR